MHGTLTQHTGYNAFSVGLGIQVLYAAWSYDELKTGPVLREILYSSTWRPLTCDVCLMVVSQSELTPAAATGTRYKVTFTLIRVRVRVPSTGFGLRLVQASTVQVSVHGHLYKDNSTRVYQQSPLKSNRENALRKSNNIPLHR